LGSEFPAIFERLAGILRAYGQTTSVAEDTPSGTA
jgi:hypothetical protein